MAGTKIGGKRCAATNKARWGETYYRDIGRRGGSKRVPKGFALDRGRASRAGYLGGMISRRGPNKLAEKRRRERRRAYEELMGIHEKAQRERATYAQPKAARLDDGAVTVFDRKRGLVREAA